MSYAEAMVAVEEAVSAREGREIPVGEAQAVAERAAAEDALRPSQQADPEIAVIGLNLMYHTRRVLKTLTPREERVLKVRFGIEEAPEEGPEGSDDLFEVTRERKRQIEAKALKKLMVSIKKDEGK
jgi:RNA polymerase primary sigma factor